MGPIPSTPRRCSGCCTSTESRRRSRWSVFMWPPTRIWPGRSPRLATISPITPGPTPPSPACRFIECTRNSPGPVMPSIRRPASTLSCSALPTGPGRPPLSGSASGCGWCRWTGRSTPATGPGRESGGLSATSCATPTRDRSSWSTTEAATGPRPRVRCRSCSPGCCARATSSRPCDGLPPLRTQAVGGLLGIGPVGAHLDLSAGQEVQHAAFAAVGQGVEQKLVKREPQPDPRQYPPEMVRHEIGSTVGGLDLRRQRGDHQSQSGDGDADPQGADGPDPLRLALPAVVVDPVVAVPAQSPGQPLRHPLVDGLRGHPDLQPDRAHGPAAAQFAEADIDPGEKVTVLREQVRAGHLKHVACLHQPQLDDLPFSPVQRASQDLDHAGPPYGAAALPHLE